MTGVSRTSLYRSLKYEKHCKQRPGEAEWRPKCRHVKTLQMSVYWLMQTIQNKSLERCRNGKLTPKKTNRHDY